MEHDNPKCIYSPWFQNDHLGFPPTWSVVTRAEAEPHQGIKPNEKENTGTSITEAPCPPISKNFNIVTSHIRIVTKKTLSVR